jgi:RHS repeat-associated protein
VGTGTPRLGPGIYDYNARFYDATIGRFLSADTIVPHPINPQSYNRYSYGGNSPIMQIDPSGHDNLFWDFVEAVKTVAVEGGGFVAGTFSGVAEANIPEALATDLKSSLDGLSQNSPGFGLGRTFGNGAAVVQGFAEAIVGGGTAGSGMAMCATGVLCGPGVATVAGGTALVGHGALVAGNGAVLALRNGNALLESASKPQKHHIATDKNDSARGQWTRKFRPMFEKAGIDISTSEDNLVSLTNHKGPHPEEYHEWVFRRLEGAVKGLEGKNYTIALQTELRDIAKILQKNPEIVNNGPYPK